MLFDIIQKKKGKEEIIFTDTRPNCNNRLKQLRSSNCPQANFIIVKSESTVKFEKPRKKHW